MRIAVVGAGIVGSLIARELSRYETDILLFEREADIGWGITKANSAIVHAGFHDKPDSVRARFCASGNELYDKLCRELDVPFNQTGAYVLAFNDAECTVLEQLAEQGKENGAPGLELHDAAKIQAREPALNKKIVRGLWSPTVAITEPWTLAIAAVENAVKNGLELKLSEDVIDIVTDSNRVSTIVTGRGQYTVDAVVNAAGLFADRLAGMVGLDKPSLWPRRGEYVILEQNDTQSLNTVLFPAPTETSKGILALPTIDGGLLLGPTAQDLPTAERMATQTTTLGLRSVVDGARQLLPDLDLSEPLKSFAGLRPESPQEDFVLGETAIAGFYQAAAMRSPGLTAAPAVAEWLVHEIIVNKMDLHEKESFIPYRRPVPRTSELTDKQWEALIDEDPRYGQMVCRCNYVTEGEIVDAIHRGAHTLDGVKFRTRAGFGRCQGGFCTAKIMTLLAQEMGCSLDKIVYRDTNSWITDGKVRP